MTTTKLQSANVNVTGGYALIHNLNVFGDIYSDTGKLLAPLPAFREAMRRASILTEELLSVERSVYDSDRPSLVELAVPTWASTIILDSIGAQCSYTLTRGLVVFNGFVINAGDSIAFSLEDEARMSVYKPNGENTGVLKKEFAKIVPMQVKDMRYDTYNSDPITDVDVNVMKELGVVVDGPKLEDLTERAENGDFEYGIIVIKYATFYAPNIGDVLVNQNVTHILGVETGNELLMGVDSETEFDRAAFDRLSGVGPLSDMAIYDYYMVEFLNVKSPFGYAAIELIIDSECVPENIRPEAHHDHKEAYSGDNYTSAFDKSILDNYNEVTMEQRLAVLQEIAEG